LQGTTTLFLRVPPYILAGIGLHTGVKQTSINTLCRGANSAVFHAEVLHAIPSFLQGCRQLCMPGKAKKGKPGSTVGGSTDTASLLSLPAPVLTHIAESCWRSYSGGVAAIHGHPLLGVSQACRDAVLHATKTIRLVPDFRQAGPSAAQKSAAARLLHRACCEAAPGLKVVLDTDFFPADMLSVLLQPGLRNGGWTKVHSLKVSLLQFVH
jgi:hypothetical protein